jgi:hypothetical protein
MSNIGARPVASAEPRLNRAMARELRLFYRCWLPLLTPGLAPARGVLPNTDTEDDSVHAPPFEPVAIELSALWV